MCVCVRESECVCVYMCERESVCVCVPTYPYFGDKFVPKSEVNLTKPPFGDVLICKTG